MRKLFTSTSIAMAVYGFMAILCAQAVAQDRLDMQGTAIIGNRELPKVLYIVPWQSAQRIPLDTPPFSSILDQPMGMIERKELQQTLQIHHLLNKPEVAETRQP